MAFHCAEWIFEVGRKDHEDLREASYLAEDIT